MATKEEIKAKALLVFTPKRNKDGDKRSMPVGHTNPHGFGKFFNGYLSGYQQAEQDMQKKLTDATLMIEKMYTCLSLCEDVINGDTIIGEQIQAALHEYLKHKQNRR